MKKKKGWYNKTIEETLNSLHSHRDGLSLAEFEKRLKLFGENKIKEEQKFKALKLFFRKFNSLLIYILMGTSVITFILGQMIEFYSILFVIAFSVVLGFFHEYRAEKSVEALSNLTTKKVEVIRDGKKELILSEHLVPGDIVVIKRGIILPADIRLIQASNIAVNESILTGESQSKNKTASVITKENVDLSDRKNVLFSGTSVMSGTGIGVVFATGLDTEIGKISKTLSSIKMEKTPLQRKIDVMSGRISWAVIGLSIVALTILIGRGEDLTATLILVAALAVAGIPEEFPLALTMALSSGIAKMAKKNAIVKDMASVETLGTTTVICTDKTGTLTQNKMMTVKYNCQGDEVEIDGHPYEPHENFTVDGKKINKNMLAKHKHLFKCAILCNNAEIRKDKKGWQLIGEPTEGALLGLATSAGYKEENVRNENKRVFEEPFDSSKKFMITINKEGTEHTAYLKGAAEKVLEKSKYIRSKGKIRKITKKDVEEIERILHEYSSSALRVLALATKKLNNGKNKKELAHGFVFEGIVGIHDPVREEVFESIEQCKTAGIRIIMITGDHKNTAQAIGLKLGIVNEEYNKVIEGKELDKLTDKQLDKEIVSTAIFARVTPEHKFRIVSSLQRIGEIVAMTGDGVNDAPALKKADIGVSMGKEGTDVAREASNMILTDDAFSSIVSAIKEGRTIYSNIRRFSYFLLSVNAAEVGLILLAIMLNLLTPLTALMILFINVIISSLPALGLSIESTNPKVMHNLPRHPKEKILSGYILLKMATLVPLMIVSAMALFLWEMNYGGGSIETARTYAFLSIIIGELFHAFNARRLHTTIFDKKMLENKYFYLGIVVSAILVLYSIYDPWFNMLLGTIPITGMEWLVIILISSPVLLMSELFKLVIRSELAEQKKQRGVNMIIE